MTKKTAILISAVLFIILAGLIVCEFMNPTGGPALLESLLG